VTWRVDNWVATADAHLTQTLLAKPVTDRGGDRLLKESRFQQWIGINRQVPGD
jgi:hypothetical protein